MTPSVCSSRAAPPEVKSSVKAVGENVLCQSRDLVRLQRGAPLHRHVDGDDVEDFAFHHSAGRVARFGD